MFYQIAFTHTIECDTKFRHKREVETLFGLLKLVRQSPNKCTVDSVSNCFHVSYFWLSVNRFTVVKSTRSL